MNNDTKKKAVLITGSSRGLGRVAALRFARGGWDVVINYKTNRGGAESAAEEARSLGAAVEIIQADVTKDTDRQKLVDGALESFGRLDCLVNNAAIIERRLLPSLSPDEWDSVLATDLTCPLKLTRMAAEKMSAGGAIIHISSMCGVWGCPGQSAYSAAKAAFGASVKDLAERLRERGITINSIAPGYLATDMGASNVPAMERAKNLHAMNRLSDPAGAAEFIYTLAQMKNTTGQFFILDGRIR